MYQDVNIFFIVEQSNISGLRNNSSFQAIKLLRDQGEKRMQEKGGEKKRLGM